MGLKIKRRSLGGLLATLPTFPLPSSAVLENQARQEANVVVQKGRKERERRREEGRERQKNEEMGRKEEKEEGENYRKGWRGMEEGTGRKGMKRGRRERDEKLERDRQRDRESERGASSAALSYPHPVYTREAR